MPRPNATPRTLASTGEQGEAADHGAHESRPWKTERPLSRIYLIYLSSTARVEPAIWPPAAYGLHSNGRSDSLNATFNAGTELVIAPEFCASASRTRARSPGAKER